MVGIPVAVLMGGCTATSDPEPPPTAATAPPTGDAQASDLSKFEQQLPLSGQFVSQATATEGTVDIERRNDGSVWVLLEDFHTGDAADLRLYLKEDALLQDADGFWGSAEGGYEIAVIDPGASTQEIEVPGAWDMPAIQSLTVMDYTPPDFPALGSVTLD
nr:hypothetical protein BJQ95_02738 [Cryobacterium sp. SO1]